MHRTHRIARLGRVLTFGSLIVATPLTASAQPDALPPVIGRWDLRVTGPDGEYPSWLEVWASGYSALVGRFVGGVGSARPIGEVHFTESAASCTCDHRLHFRHAPYRHRGNS